jgi:hypothetical protein
VRQKGLVHQQLKDQINQRERFLNEERLRHIHLLDEAKALSEIEREMNECWEIFTTHSSLHLITHFISNAKISPSSVHAHAGRNQRRQV